MKTNVNQRLTSLLHVEDAMPTNYHMMDHVQWMWWCMPMYGRNVSIVPVTGLMNSFAENRDVRRASVRP